MPFFDYASCEPLRVWNRLEPRTRRVDFDAALAATIHDPMWMLARQWQLGEFKGEDTGSGVLAKVARTITPVATVSVGGGAPEAEDLSLPAEARVERLPVDFAPLERAQIGRTFLLMAAEEAAAHAPATPFSAADYRAWFGQAFPLAAPAPGSDVVRRARARADGRAGRVAAALAGRAVDGVALARALAGGATLVALGAQLAARLPADHGPLVLAALGRFRDWFDALYPAPPAATGWDQAQLEYQAECTAERGGGAVALRLGEHTTGSLDWYAYDHGSVGAAGSGSTTEVRSMLLAPAEFAGMPNPRWWQLEDAAVDLGHFRAQATDIAKIVVAEFALLYGNNWSMFPFHQPLGSLAEVEGIVVTDVFGRRTLVSAAVPSSGGRWTDWDLFSLSPHAGAASASLPQHLFLPSAAGQVLEGEPRETVALVRDESADMVWGVELRVPDGLGGGRDGSDAARRFTAALADLLAAQDGEPADGGQAPALRYLLGTSVPESWIPFLPVHTSGGSRDIVLQRASMPRLAPPGLVRPLTSILRFGLDDGDHQQAAYLLNEEEVPRAGVRVAGGMRRARWLGGRTVVWHARTVTAGRGEADSGLRFDVVENRDAPA